MTITTNDVGHVALGDNVYQNVTLQFPQGDTYVEGTIMARKDVSDTIPDVIAQQGSGDYTAVVTAHDMTTPEVGAYIATAGTLTSGYGQWTLVAPISGRVEKITTLSAAEDLEFPALGIKMAITAVSNPFETGTTITATVAADGDVVVYDPDGKGGAQTPIGVLPYEKTVSAQSDVAGNIITGGKVNKNRLVIDDGTTVTDVHVQLLKQVGIFALDQDDLSMLDNGAS